ncbi:PTS sugar transporter subunit IIC [Beduini massiliensis]|uniref:PTS sugar transporter subunit IIC n=1 Tax=Beduini massiliensis TaxID=1585974 RepID=UPI00059A9F27|nr:PTS transporter subunit EIIC [Beduini massiliensis]
MKFLEEKFIPLASKIGSQRHLVAIRDAFVVTMPLTIVGAIAVLINNIHGIFADNGLNIPAIQQGYAKMITSTGIKDVMTAVNKGSINMMAVLLVVTLGFNMAKGLDGDGIATSAVALTCYLGLTPAVQTLASHYTWANNTNNIDVLTTDIASGGIAANKLDSNGMFVGMILTIIVSEIFVRLSRNDKLKITLPDGVPPAVAGSFTVLIPAVLTVIMVVAVGTYIERLSGMNLWIIIQKFVSSPLNSVADTVGTAVLVYFLITFLWTFGLHGSNIVGAVTKPIFTPMLLENTSAYEAGDKIPNIIPGLYPFVAIGGSGSTLGLIIAILLFSKVQSEKTVVGISIAPGIFGINEPLTFGIPIVMNPIYMIPFIVGPVVLSVLTYLLMQFNIIDRTCLNVPWVTPPLLYAFLATGGSFKSMLWNAIEIVFLTILWMPFVQISNKQSAIA